MSDWWEGLDELFVPDREILYSRSPEDTLAVLTGTSEEERRKIAHGRAPACWRSTRARIESSNLNAT